MSRLLLFDSKPLLASIFFTEGTGSLCRLPMGSVRIKMRRATRKKGNYRYTGNILKPILA